MIWRKRSRPAPDAIARRLADDAQRLSQATLTRAGEAGNARLRQAYHQIDQWADAIGGAGITPE